MFPNVLATGHSTLESSCSSFALSFLAPQEGYLLRSASIAFSIGSAVACEQLWGLLLRFNSPSGPLSL